MKKQIESKRYNTDCARLIGYGIFEQEIAKLFMKKSGECFIVTDTQIIPITDNKAHDFAREFNLRAKYIEALEYNKLPKKQASIYLTTQGRKDLEEICKNWKLSFSEAIDRMIRQTDRDMKKDKEKKQNLIDHILAELSEEAQPDGSKDNSAAE